VYDEAGPFLGVSAPGLLAWLAGAVVFFAAASIGGTLPSLVVVMLIDTTLHHSAAEPQPNRAHPRLAAGRSGPPI